MFECTRGDFTYELLSAFPWPTDKYLKIQRTFSWTFDTYRNESSDEQENVIDYATMSD